MATAPLRMSTHKAGLLEESVRWGSGCTWLDYDRDGHLDLFVCNYIKLDPATTANPGDAAYCQWKGIPVMCGPRGLPGDTNLLFHNNGDGTFTDVTEKAGILKPGPRYSITAVSYDFDNDGWPDIYVAVDSEPSILFHNNHDGTFTDIAVMAGCAYNENGHEQAGMGVAVGDYDCDGWFDIFKTNFSDDTCNLYHNNGDGTFTDVDLFIRRRHQQPVCRLGLRLHRLRQRWLAGYHAGQRSRLPGNRGAIALVRPSRILASYTKISATADSRTFQPSWDPASANVSPAAAPLSATTTTTATSTSLILNMNDMPSLLRNDGGNTQNWIKVKLIGTQCNRTAIGARVRVVTGNHTQMDEVHSGASVMSQSDLRLHFGLGKAPVVDVIEVKWPTTQKSGTIHAGQSNQILTIREGSGIVASSSLNRNRRNSHRLFLLFEGIR